MRVLWEEFLAADERTRLNILTIVVWPSLLVIGLLLRELHLQTQHSLWAAMALVCALAFVPFTLWVAKVSMPHLFLQPSTQRQLSKSIPLAKLSNPISTRDRTSNRLRRPNQNRQDF
ncbi:MAG: hypothetical protein AAGM36_15490 [Cyanobacteria bacterium J06597_1]